MRDGRIFSRLDAQDDVIAVGADRVRVGAIQIDHNPSDRRVCTVQANAYALYAVGVQREMFLFCVGESTRKR